MSFGMVEQRKLMINSIKQIIISKSPIDKDKLVALVMFETGLTKNKSREYIKIFKDMDMIELSDEGVITWKGK